MWERRNAPRTGHNPAMLEWNPRQAARHLSAADPKMAAVVERIGPCRYDTFGKAEPFYALFRSIVYQQLSGKAARTIWDRVIAHFPRRWPRPAGLLELTDTDLRGAGLSRAKVAAARDLAAKVLDGTVPSLRKLKRMDDAAVIGSLSQVRGIGTWTAEMFLMFRLGRPDVLPLGDLGVRKGFMIGWNKRKLPSPEALARAGRRWAPYRSAAAWYLWRIVDDQTGGGW